LVARHTPGTTARLAIVRGGATKTMDATVDELKDENERADAQETEGGSQGRGSAGGLGIAVGQAPGPQGGVVVGRVLPGGAAEGQLLPVDLIVEVNSTPVRSAGDLVSHLRAAPSGHPVLLKIKREGKSHFVAISLRPR